jgi:hypothetical protein
LRPKTLEKFGILSGIVPGFLRETSALAEGPRCMQKASGVCSSGGTNHEDRSVGCPYLWLWVWLYIGLVSNNIDVKKKLEYIQLWMVEIVPGIFCRYIPLAPLLHPPGCPRCGFFLAKKRGGASPFIKQCLPSSWVIIN